MDLKESQVFEETEDSTLVKKEQIDIKMEMISAVVESM